MQSNNKTNKNSNKSQTKRKPYASSRSKKASRPPPRAKALPRRTAPGQRDVIIGDEGIQNVEVVSCNVNPYPVLQSLYGYFGAHLSHFDSEDAQSVIHQLVWFSFNNLRSLEGSGVSYFPDFVVWIANSLAPRRVGRIMLVPNWESMLAAVANYNNGADFSSVTNAAIGAPSTYTSGGYAATYVSTGLLPGAVSYTQLLQGYTPGIKLLPSVTTGLLAPQDCSGFAFDLGTAVQSGSANYDLGTYWQCGSTSTKTTAVYLPETSTVGCEGPMYTRWIASLRMCTPVDYVAGVGVNQISQRRRPGSSPKCIMEVSGIPASIGHIYMLKKGRLPKVVQIKIAPANSAIGDVARRIEATLNATDQVTNFKASFSPTEATLLMYAIWFSSIAKMGWYTMGAAYFSSSNIVQYSIPGMHAFFKIWETIQVPDTVASLLGATQIWDDKDGLLLPGFGPFLLSAYPGTYSYTGANNIGFPTTQLSQQFFKSALNIVQKYRQYEKNMSTVTNMRPITKLGPSMLDISITRDQYAPASDGVAKAVGMFSRRPIPQQRMNAALQAINFISYDVQAYGGGNPTSSIKRLKLYRQPYYEPLSVNDTIADLSLVSMFQGIVLPGTSANQNVGPNEAAASNGSTWWWNSLSAVAPTYGSYGGPGYTAGVDSRHVNPAMRRGPSGRMEYLVAPLDAEDAAYKRHDEDYFAVGRGEGTYAQADAELFRSLKAVRKSQGGLSPYGSAALELFRPARSLSLFDE